jgi:formate hydrogenlyase subunit 6/NADH:ubiquinone oxidoreductase subunit I
VNVFRGWLRARNATRPYPLAAEPAPAGFRGQILIDTARCDGNAACAAVCPSAAIAVVNSGSSWTWELNDARCVFCGLCVDACPTSALSQSGEFELAVRRSGDLVTRIGFERGEPRP